MDPTAMMPAAMLVPPKFERPEPARPPSSVNSVSSDQWNAFETASEAGSGTDDGPKRKQKKRKKERKKEKKRKERKKEKQVKDWG